jgi:hypothetical protein
MGSAHPPFKANLMGLMVAMVAYIKITPSHGRSEPRSIH